MFTRQLEKVACILMAAAILSPTNTSLRASPQTTQSLIEATLDNITNLNRPGQDGYATIWDGNKYVQCRRLPDRGLGCEAAGALMQSSLERVLSPERAARLIALGWRLDPSFGNYVQVFPADTASSLLADKIARVLREAYDADVADLEVQSTWIQSEPCPPRNGPSQNLAGIVNDAPWVR
jgi:type III secretion system-like peptide-binding chaperone